MSRGITKLDKETGAGNPGPEWAVGAQGVEVEYDPRTYTYKITKAVSVMDIGKVLNEKTARGQVTGAMSMGIAFAGRETFYFDEGGRVLNPQLRTYRPLRFGEQPEYICEFIEYTTCRWTVMEREVPENMGCLACRLLWEIVFLWRREWN